MKCLTPKTIRFWIPPILIVLILSGLSADQLEDDIIAGHYALQEIITSLKQPLTPSRELSDSGFSDILQIVNDNTEQYFSSMAALVNLTFIHDEGQSVAVDADVGRFILSQAELHEYAGLYAHYKSVMDISAVFTDFENFVMAVTGDFIINPSAESLTEFCDLHYDDLFLLDGGHGDDLVTVFLGNAVQHSLTDRFYVMEASRVLLAFLLEGSSLKLMCNTGRSVEYVDEELQSFQVEYAVAAAADVFQRTVELVQQYDEKIAKEYWLLQYKEDIHTFADTNVYEDGEFGDRFVEDLFQFLNTKYFWREWVVLGLGPIDDFIGDVLDDQDEEVHRSFRVDVQLDEGDSCHGLVDLDYFGKQFVVASADESVFQGQGVEGVVDVCGHEHQDWANKVLEVQSKACLKVALVTTAYPSNPIHVASNWAKFSQDRSNALCDSETSEGFDSQLYNVLLYKSKEGLLYTILKYIGGAVCVVILLFLLYLFCK